MDSREKCQLLARFVAVIQFEAEMDAPLVGSKAGWFAGIAGSLYGAGRTGGVHRLAGTVDGLGMLSFVFAIIAVLSSRRTFSNPRRRATIL